jgi:exosortase
MPRCETVEPVLEDSPKTARGPSRALFFWQVAVVFALLSVLYFRVLGGLVDEWIRNPDYSHGLFVPLFAGWVLWQKRRTLELIPRKPALSGLLVVLAALGMLVLGILGAEVYISRTSLLFLFAGLVIYFAGWRTFRAVIFPWSVLFLMIPLPAIIFNEISLPLQFEASRLAAGLLNLIGVPVLREGNIIVLPSLTLDVAEACSGLRSLVSLITLSIFYGYLFEPRISRRMPLILAAIPVAVLANGIRIMGSGVLGEYWSPDKAEGFFHLFSGWLIFVCSLLLLLGFHAGLNQFMRRVHEQRL